ncbi:MAG: hypothetical protein ACRD2T_16205 [Thermoanaerobaculia bacterium]
MVFVAGPRQVGKTTLARSLPGGAEGYLSWDAPEDRERILRRELVACHLLKWVHFQQDTQGRDLELRYFRDLEGREVDFVVTERRRPVLMVECKAADAPLDRSLRYLKTRFPDCPAWQLSAQGTRDYQTPEGIRVAPGLVLLGQLV